jgi:hypothetical protein
MSPRSQWVMAQGGPLAGGPGTPSATLKFSIGGSSGIVPIVGARYENVVNACKISSKQTTQIAAQDCNRLGLYGSPPFAGSCQI